MLPSGSAVIVGGPDHVIVAPLGRAAVDPSEFTFTTDKASASPSVTLDALPCAVTIRYCVVDVVEEF